MIYIRNIPDSAHYQYGELVGNDIRYSDTVMGLLHRDFKPAKYHDLEKWLFPFYTPTDLPHEAIHLIEKL